jgi:hypothetical protein
MVYLLIEGRKDMVSEGLTVFLVFMSSTNQLISLLVLIDEQVSFLNSLAIFSLRRKSCEMADEAVRI